MKRGVVRTVESEFLGVWVPKSLVVLMESAIGGADRSKFIRAALRERLAKKQANKACPSREVFKS